MTQINQTQCNQAQSNQAKNSQDQDAANDTFNGKEINNSEEDVIYLDADNSVNLSSMLSPYYRPDEQTIVCGALDDEKVHALAKAGVELVINLQLQEELSFDEAAAVQQAGMAYEHLPIGGAEDLKQLKILAFDKLLRQYHGKKVAMHCGSGNRVGAAMTLRSGWLRGRKMDTAMKHGYDHGLTSLEQEAHNRLLVPR
ncbi:MAG: sulfur transferase domain-containing protein [Psychrobacter sp.]|nr:sulfur transferase domain-containing protein [Psychrobacter sp.]